MTSHTNLKFDLWAIDDSDLDVYQFRIFCHIARVGICFQSVHTIADACKMSSGKASSTRNWLKKNGYISLTKDERSGRFGYQIVPFWRSPDEQAQQNSSPDEQNVHHVNGNVHDMNADVHHVNLRNTTIRQQHKANDYIYDPIDELIQPLRTALSQVVRETDLPEFDAAKYKSTAEVLNGRDATPDDVIRFGEWWKDNGWHSEKPVLKNIVNNWGDFLNNRCLKGKPKQTTGGHSNGSGPHKETAAERVARLFPDEVSK